MEPRTKPAKNTFGMRRYPKAVMADYPDKVHGIPPTTEEVMTVKNYIKAVKNGKIPKGPSHAAIEEFVKKPHAQQTQVIVLNLRTTQEKVRHQATQIYLKTREIATQPPWVQDTDEARRSSL